MALKDEVLAAVARNLVAFGYPGVTAQMVREQLTKPKADRNIIGTFAAGMLVENGAWASEDEVLE